MRWGPTGVLAVGACTLALVPAASAKVVAAETILPPGQSGFVAPAGLLDGSGSPHLYDQQAPYIAFQRKPATFHQPGTKETPRPGVEIVRDRYGVPAVSAGSDYDAWWGAGYAIAQDRLFQLEIFRRATQGRLAEILGKGYLDMDYVARRDYYTPAELDRMLAALPAGLRARFDAYAAGVNAWIRHVEANPLDMPAEFLAEADLPIRPWTARDSAAIGVFLARTVPSGDGAELRNLAALRSIGPQAFDEILPLRVRRQVTSVPKEDGSFPSQPGRTRAQERAAFRRSIAATRDMPLPGAGETRIAAAKRSLSAGRIGHVGGSYMFAVRRPDGHTILFNGPQLGFSDPELFVELEVHAPGLDVRGATAPGVPVIGLGQNEHVAWGVTSGLSDDNDLYAEETVPGHPEEYVFDGGVRRMDCREETFDYRSPPTDLLAGKVPGAGSQRRRVCRTLHGPVQERAGGTAYARRYAIWGRELETLVGLSELNAASSVREVDAALRDVTWNENVVAVDDHGHMGYWHPGLHPLRPRGYDERLPYPGTGEAEWRGLLDRREDPHVIDPEQGYLFNWNNVPSEGWTSGDGPATERLTGAYHRAAWLRRLVRRLAKDPSFAGAQHLITRSGTTAQQRPLARDRLRKAATGLPESPGPGDHAAIVLRTLLAWDGSFARTDAKGTVDPGVAAWEAFKDAMQAMVLERLGAGAKGIAGQPGSSHVFEASNGQAYGLRTFDVDGYREAASRAYDALVRRFGSADPASWREPRRMYAIDVQGAGQPPPLPFFDRGTFEQLVELGPDD